MFSKLTEEFIQKKHHGATEEIKTGINLSGENYKDLAKTYIGNFENNHEWVIAEYISDNACTNKRQGNYLSKARPEIKNYDDNSENRINNILIDMGGTQKITHTQEEAPSAEAISNKLMNEPAEKREEIFYEILKSNDPAKKNGLGYAIDSLDWDKSKQYFYDVLNDPHHETKNGLENNFDILPEKDMKQAHKDWMEYLKLQITLFQTNF